MAADPVPAPPLLSPSQRRLVAFALTLTALLGSIALLVTAFFVTKWRLVRWKYFSRPVVAA